MEETIELWRNGDVKRNIPKQFLSYDLQKRIFIDYSDTLAKEVDQVSEELNNIVVNVKITKERFDTWDCGVRIRSNPEYTLFNGKQGDEILELFIPNEKEKEMYSYMLLRKCENQSIILTCQVCLEHAKKMVNILEQYMKMKTGVNYEQDKLINLTDVIIGNKY